MPIDGQKRSDALQTVIEFCLDYAPSAPVQRRILLYRGLAEFCGDRQEAARFNEAARNLENADLQSRQLALAFRRP